MLTDAATDQRLIEWSRFVRADSRHRRRCGFAEKGWRSPQHWQELTQTIPATINVESVMQVEHVVVRLDEM